MHFFPLHFLCTHTHKVNEFKSCFILSVLSHAFLNFTKHIKSIFLVMKAYHKYSLTM